MMGDKLSDRLRQLAYNHYAPGDVGRNTYGDAAAAIDELVEALENLLSADPDMPTYQADVDRAEAILVKYGRGE